MSDVDFPHTHAETSVKSPFLGWGWNIIRCSLVFTIGYIYLIIHLCSQYMSITITLIILCSFHVHVYIHFTEAGIISDFLISYRYICTCSYSCNSFHNMQIVFILNANRSRKEQRLWQMSAKCNNFTFNLYISQLLWLLWLNACTARCIITSHIVNML